MTGTGIVEFWFDFSCPYAYLASRRIEAIAAHHGVELELCPMLLGGVFRAIGAGDGPMATQHAARARHNVLDMHRWAERLAVPFVLPATHPMRTVRALRVLLGLPRPTWAAAMHAIYAAYWQRAEDVTADRVIAAALAAAGVPPATIDAAVAGADSDAIKTELRRRTDLAVARGVFGAPAYVVHRDARPPVLLWGQDRLGFLDALLAGWDPDAAPPPGGPQHVAVPPPSGAPRVIELWFDLGSPFAYLGSTQIEAVARAAGAELRWRPILLGALFRELGTPDVPWFAMPDAKRKYSGLDMQRWARWWGVPFVFPSRFPQRTVTALRLIQAAGHPGDAPPVALIHRLFRAMWVDDLPIEDEAVLARLCTEVGLDPALVDATREPAAKAALKASTDAARAAGVFGVPTMIVHGAAGTPSELFWGQDRLELVAAVAATGRVGVTVMIAAVVATAISAVACVALVVAERAGRRGRRARLVSKPLASAAFIAVPLVGGGLGADVGLGDHATWIVAGLVLGAIGDVLLLFEALFLAGLVVFLLGHVAYVVGFAVVVPVLDWPRIATWQAMAAVAAGATALAWLWPHLGKMRIPVIAYVSVIVVMVIGAAAVSAHAPWPQLRASLVIVGAALFFASDLSVARDWFVETSFVNRLWGLPVYYAAQLVLGWSLLVPSSV